MKPEGYRFHAHAGHTCPAELVFVAEVGEVAEVAGDRVQHLLVKWPSVHSDRKLSECDLRTFFFWQ